LWMPEDVVVTAAQVCTLQTLVMVFERTNSKIDGRNAGRPGWQRADCTQLVFCRTQL
jgi:hypothetical protein